MEVQFHRNFKKSFSKQPKHIQEKLFEALDIFSEDQFDYRLNNHPLTGKLKLWRSFNVTGDVRVHYRETETSIILMDIGSHSQLYG